MKPHLALPIMAVMFIIASCAEPVKWQKPYVGQQQWAIDRATCENKARRQLAREQATRNMLNAGDETNDANTYEKNMSIYTDRRRVTLIKANCLKKMGYEVIPKKQP